MFRGCENLKTISLPSTMMFVGENTFDDCPRIEDVYCFSEEAYQYGSWSKNGTYAQYATLHVPSKSMVNYRRWGFGNIVSLDDEDYNEVRCAMPTIEYADGKLVFHCDTKDVTFISEILCEDAKTFETDEVVLNFKHTVCVYATKLGYIDSQKAYFDIPYVREEESLYGDVNKDGQVNITDIVDVVNAIASGAQ